MADIVHSIRCDSGVIIGWWVGTGISGDASVLCPVTAAGADCSTERRVVQPTAAAARHRLHRRPRAGASLIRISCVVVAPATAAATRYLVTSLHPPSSHSATPWRRSTVIVCCVSLGVSWPGHRFVVAWSLSYFVAIVYVQSMYTTWQWQRNAFFLPLIMTAPNNVFSDLAPPPRLFLRPIVRPTTLILRSNFGSDLRLWSISTVVRRSIHLFFHLFVAPGCSAPPPLCSWLPYV